MMGMTRAIAEILDDIDTFGPVDGNCLRLECLLDELWQSDVPPSALPTLFGVFERFPDDDGQGVLWSIVHGIEARNDYEQSLCESLTRRPSFMGNVMLKRLRKSQSG
jgi:hypothetical protein